MAPDWRKWAGRPWAQELAIVMKKCNILVRIWRVPRVRKMGRKALDPRIGKCHTENVCYFSKDWEGLQIGKNKPGGPGPKNQQMS